MIGMDRNTTITLINSDLVSRFFDTFFNSQFFQSEALFYLTCQLITSSHSLVTFFEGGSARLDRLVNKVVTCQKRDDKMQSLLN